VKKAIFFDLYGTLIDIKTDEDELWVYEKLSRYLLYHSVDIAPEELKKAYFEGIRQHLSQNKEIYPDVDVYKIFSDIMHKYSKKKYSKGIVIDIAMLFRSLTIRHFGVFAGLYDVLYLLSKSYKIAIISDAQWVFAEPEIAMLGLDQFFKLRILSSRFGFKKPDTRLFHHAMEGFGVNSEESVYIGDNPFKDLSGAKKAGMEFILFRSECREYNGFQPDRCFYDYSELEDILHKMMYY
jgi:putative hydrolase of the HAD superfamily